MSFFFSFKGNLLGLETNPVLRILNCFFPWVGVILLQKYNRIVAFTLHVEIKTLQPLIQYLFRVREVYLGVLQLRENQGSKEQSEKQDHPVRPGETEGPELKEMPVCQGLEDPEKEEIREIVDSPVHQAYRDLMDSRGTLDFQDSRD